MLRINKYQSSNHGFIHPKLRTFSLMKFIRLIYARKSSRVRPWQDNAPSRPDISLAEPYLTSAAGETFAAWEATPLGKRNSFSLVYPRTSRARLDLAKYIFCGGRFESKIPSLLCLAAKSDSHCEQIVGVCTLKKLAYT